MIVIGLTGSIGMGKSTTTAMFAERGIPVADSDAIVHALYAGKAAPAVEAAFPGTTGPDGIDRDKLSRRVLGDREALQRLESIVHPLVREAQRAFLDDARAQGADIALLDIPLLFESNGAERVDSVVVVSCAPEIQRERVMARAGMSEEKFQAILARQMPDAEKRRRADFVVDTGHGLEAARAQVDQIIAKLRSGGEKDG
ncbi:dephospho-CoA kinase [Pararhizobium haloflavum]|uniref:dephospho-CoA kinase n=1 Tax=Pararhizobium haloflavum TaxID=2037914 RepID=UPI000C1A2B94|nr:dephospho-CoA kinase [Pararhizobium haloflavum]